MSWSAYGGWPPRVLFAAALAIADHEDIGLLDSYERHRARWIADLLRDANVNINLRVNLSVFRTSDDTAAVADQEDAKVDAAEKEARRTLPVIHPVVDGRLKDVAPTK
ncbi:hypothetical protein NM688_g2448 [Phlebia brevispora]|uniref:Uncharacterized protein n=1 Tax=Phlebia brevispora TaxID=194682 RepID=A0ACC1T8G8_9APHY|nr:hypothetical protein NM688_g2448 [Phlebia brevispora]